MDPKFVCVLDMDLTLGFYDNKKFHVRPKFKTFLRFLKIIKADIILWSHGKDQYVSNVVNAYLPELVTCAHTLFGRTECEYSERYYNFLKASEHIRDMYKKRYGLRVFLIAVDDNVAINMDEGYDLRIHIQPYSKVNSCDKELLVVIEKMVDGIASLTKQDV